MGVEGLGDRCGVARLGACENTSVNLIPRYYCSTAVLSLGSTAVLIFFKYRTAVTRQKLLLCGTGTFFLKITI
jgi:hypothetical protein